MFKHSNLDCEVTEARTLCFPTSRSLVLVPRDFEGQTRTLRDRALVETTRHRYERKGSHLSQISDPGRDTPARVDSLTSKSAAKLAQPHKGLGDSTGDRVQSGWVG